MPNRARKTTHGSQAAGDRQARRQSELWRKRAEGLAERQRRLVCALNARDVPSDLRAKLLRTLGVPDQP